MNTKRLCDFFYGFACESFAISIVVITVLQVSLLAQSSTGALSKEKLVALKNADVSDSVLIQQIQKDGISFDMTADTTLELRNAGFSNDVLQALLQASSKTKFAATQPAQLDSVAALYKTGRFPELADRLRDLLKVNPSDYKTQALLIMTLLKMKERDAAHAEFQQLAGHEQDPAAVSYLKQIKVLFDTLDKTEEAKKQLIAALKDYRTADAIAAVDKLPASPLQKGILEIELDMYQGKFDQGRDRFSKIAFTRYSEKERAVKMLNQISETEAAYKKLRSRIDVYLYSKMAPTSCNFPLAGWDKYDPEMASLSVQEYINLVNTLTQVAPLDDYVRNLSFHGQLLTGDYAQLELVGDRLLKASGNIRIPFYASDRFFQVVIDSQNRRVFTEPDPRPFTAKYVGYNKPGRSVNDWWAELVPFDLPFDQIKELSQKAGHLTVGLGTAMPDWPAKKSYALKFEPRGLAPNYAVRNILYCSAGEKAELTVTRNLGQYILHVIGSSGIKTDLADPSKAKGQSSGWMTGLLMAGASLSSNPGLRDAAIQGLQADQAQQMATYQAEATAWSTFTNQETFSFIEADAFTGLEELLGVLN